jgi:hypothetical protein
MGVQTDVLIADPDEAQAVADTECPAVDREGFTFSGFDRVQLCTLLSILKTGAPEAEFDRYLDRIKVVTASSGEWPVVSIVPAELVAEVSAVGGLEGDEFEVLAAAWAMTEEFEGWSPSDVRQLLRDLGDLAESASLQDKCLLLWQIL